MKQQDSNYRVKPQRGEMRFGGKKMGVCDVKKRCKGSCGQTYATVCSAAQEAVCVYVCVSV